MPRLMKRRDPDERFRGLPCVITAVGSAGGDAELPDIHEDGYCSLREANKYIRSAFQVKKRTDYKRGDRPTLRELIKEERLANPAIVCVLGHFLYVNGDTYYSFFKNGSDEVVTTWEIEAR